jgi:hypothetical protein
MLLDEIFHCPDLASGQTEVLRQLNSGIKPKLRLATFTMNMNVHSYFLAREEIEPEPSCSENGRTQMNLSRGNSEQSLKAGALSSNSPIPSRRSQARVETVSYDPEVMR